MGGATNETTTTTAAALAAAASGQAGPVEPVSYIRLDPDQVRVGGGGSWEGEGAGHTGSQGIYFNDLTRL